MASVYYYMTINKNIITVILNCERMLKHFTFTPATANLKTALENAVEEQFAACVVDTLLQCDESVIKQFIEVLHETDQARLAAFFTIEVPNAPLYNFCMLRDYTHMQQCETPIPIEAKHNLQLNYEQIKQILQTDVTLTVMIEYLYSKGALSMHMRKKCLHAYLNHNNVSMILDIIINGNEYQYTCFKKCADNYLRFKHESDLYKYL